jgi:hypothetical protein
MSAASTATLIREKAAWLLHYRREALEAGTFDGLRVMEGCH